MKKLIVCLILTLLLAGAAAPRTLAAEDPVWTLATEDGQTLTSIATEVNVGDEYIAQNNRLYKVTARNETTRVATVAQSGDEPMPLMALWPITRTVEQTRKVGIYVTHSDESYESAEGTSSVDTGWAGIHDVALALKNSLEEKGVEVLFDDTNHLPHDSGAYRRSRSTAMNLAKQGPTAILDIHRDGIPDPSEYETEIDGTPMSKVRLLVGRSNPNSAANREFAKKIKSAADSAYPGLIKDIFIGKGNYNQEIMPHSILLEFGTHTSDKQQVLASTAVMADVLNTVLFGGTASSPAPSSSPGAGASAGGSQAGTPSGEPQAQQQGQNTRADNAGAGSGIAWLIGLAVLAVLIFAVISAGGFRGIGERLSRFGSELTGGAVGKKPKDKE